MQKNAKKDKERKKSATMDANKDPEPYFRPFIASSASVAVFGVSTIK